MITEAIIKTLNYHSKFNYSLNFPELHRFLVINRPVSSNEVKPELVKLVKKKKIIASGGFYYLSNLPNYPNFPNLPNIRLIRRQSSRPKIQIALRAAKLISLVPFVRLVCVTGSLAMENSGPDDDIDLMIVTSQNRLWLTRPLVVLLISLFFKRRAPVFKGPALPRQGRALSNSTANFANAICLNLWLDASALAMPPHRRDLRTAHELAQMKPLVNKNKTYERMMLINSWAKKYLANVWNDDSLKQWNTRTLKHQNRIVLMFSCFNVLMKLNSFLFRLQYAYMKPKITTEEVTLHSAFFHPKYHENTRT